MKITSNKKQFSESFQIAASVAASRDVKPVLQNVKMTAKKENVLLQATDTESGIRVVLDFCEVVKTGETVLFTKDLKQILQKSISEEIAIESNKEKVTISGVGGDENWVHAVQPADEFPDVEEFNAKAYHEISAATLRQVIRRTVFATDPDSTRYALGGVQFEFTDNQITSIATDGRRMSVQDGGASVAGKHKAEKAILPKRSLELLGRILDKDEETVKIAVTENLAQFQYKNKTFFTRLLEGRFPKWRDVIPNTDEKTPVEILTGTLKSAVERAAITASERSPGVIFTIQSGVMKLFAEESEEGSSDIKVPISYEGEELKVKFDPKYLVDMLSAFEDEKNLTLYFSKEDPLTIKTDDNFVYVVMPMSMER